MRRPGLWLAVANQKIVLMGEGTYLLKAGAVDAIQGIRQRSI
jgi:uncharacterized protein YegP (UPF0339 family)